jgi:hypothetical protein
MKKIVFFLAITILTGCAGIILKPVDFAWPIESVLETNKNGIITENRYSFSINVKPLFFEETKDSLHINKKTVRIIRDEKGYYYFIAPGFKNVYVFNVNDGEMTLHNKILVSELGVDLPAFNQRKPYIELLEGETHLHFLTSEGTKGTN